MKEKIWEMDVGNFVTHVAGVDHGGAMCCWFPWHAGAWSVAGHGSQACTVSPRRQRRSGKMGGVGEEAVAEHGRWPL